MTAPLALRRERLGFALHHARDGKRILVIVELQTQVRPLLDWLDGARQDASAERIAFGKGREAYRHQGGGEIVFSTAHAIEVHGRGRGESLDLVLIGGSVILSERLADFLAGLRLDPVDVHFHQPGDHR